MRWYRENPKDGSSIARSIQVGIPPENSGVIDRRTGLADGFVVPEADREVNKDPIYFVKRKSICAIPVMNEDGTLIVADADANDNNTDKQHQTDKMNEQSDRLMLVEQKV